MPRGWQWDESLYRGSAAYYVRGRLPYPRRLAGALQTALALDGTGRLLDAGTGPGILALRLASLFREVVGVDPDGAMLAEAENRRLSLGIDNVGWIQALAEHLPLRKGTFLVATFGASFHWMERERVAAAVFELLQPGGAFVQVSDRHVDATRRRAVLPYPAPPAAAVQALTARHLGPVRRAGQGTLPYGTPDGEDVVVRGAGFGRMQVVPLPGGELVLRSIDDLVALQFSNSGSAPHLFGGHAAVYEADLRNLLAEAAPNGTFAEETPDAELRIWRRP